VSVTPVSPPVFQSLTITNNTVHLTWSSTVGLAYQLQYKTDLTQGTWLNLGNPVRAASSKRDCDPTHLPRIRNVFTG